MHRAWQRFIGVLALLAVAFVAMPARAFHVGGTFDRPPGAGGGGGIFYAGAPLDHGWDCSACHQKAAGKIKVRLDVMPSSLLDGLQYTPGQVFTFTATLEGEHLGLSSPLANYNSLVVSIVDAKGFSTGSIGGFAAEDFYSGFPSTIASAGQQVGRTSWTFQWTAGQVGSGPVTLYVAAVDGNGADSGPSATLTDPFDDDVFVAAWNLKETPLTAGRTQPTFPGTLVCALGIAVTTIAQRRRRRAVAPETR
jgi:hypothetical protein